MLLAVPLTGALAAPASALTFNFAQIAGDTLTTSEAAAFTTAAAVNAGCDFPQFVLE